MYRVCRVWVGMLLATFSVGAVGGCSEVSDVDEQGNGASSSKEVFRQLCVDHINKLRATKGLAPYTRWKDAESCVDEEANLDSASNKPHGSFGKCGEMGQNACPLSSMGEVTNCLDMMWEEKEQAGCSGCDACADERTSSCSNCDFFGKETGDVCGHYVNMSAKYLHQVACGVSDNNKWIIIDFK